jgi:hypothetical protein
MSLYISSILSLLDSFPVRLLDAKLFTLRSLGSKLMEFPSGTESLLEDAAVESAIIRLDFGCRGLLNVHFIREFGNTRTSRNVQIESLYMTNEGLHQYSQQMTPYAHPLFEMSPAQGLIPQPLRIIYVFASPSADHTSVV